MVWQLIGESYVVLPREGTLSFVGVPVLGLSMAPYETDFIEDFYSNNFPGVDVATRSIDCSLHESAARQKPPETL